MCRGNTFFLLNYTGLKVMLTHETWLKCLIYNCSSWLYCSENKFLSLNMINTDCLHLLKVFKELCENRFMFFHFLDMQAWMSSFQNIFWPWQKCQCWNSDSKVNCVTRSFPFFPFSCYTDMRLCLWVSGGTCCLKQLSVICVWILA